MTGNETATTRPKVFCIGFHKTGTTSLARALQTLGYRVTGPNAIHDIDIANNVVAMATDLAQQFDAFQDNPWPIIYQEMDALFPGSKFILTVRDPQAWINSQIRRFGDFSTPMREWIYGVGCPKGNEDIYIQRLETHNAQVLSYFKDRPDDLLVMDLGRGDGWDKLCAHLQTARPDMPFPHANKGSDRDKRRRRHKRAAHPVRMFLKRMVNRAD